MNLSKDDYYFLNFPTMDDVRKLDINKDRQVVQGLILGQLLANLGIIPRVYLGKVCRPNKIPYWKLKKIAWSCEELMGKFGDDGIDAVHCVVRGDLDAVRVKSCFVTRLTKDIKELRETFFFDYEEKQSVFKRLEEWSGENIREYVKNFECTANTYYRTACSRYMKSVYKGEYARAGYGAPFKPFCDSLSKDVKEKFLSEYDVNLETIKDFSEFMRKMYEKDNLIKLAVNIKLGPKGRNITSLSYDIRELQRRIELAKKNNKRSYKGQDLNEMECMLSALLAQKEALVSGLEEDFNVSYMSFDVDSVEKNVCEFIISCLKSGFKRFVKTKRCSFGYTLGFDKEKSRFFVVFPTRHPMTKICTTNAEDNIFKIFSTLMQVVSSKFGKDIKMTRMGKLNFMN